MERNLSIQRLPFVLFTSQWSPELVVYAKSLVWCEHRNLLATSMEVGRKGKWVWLCGKETVSGP